MNDGSNASSSTCTAATLPAPSRAEPGAVRVVLDIVWTVAAAITIVGLHVDYGSIHAVGDLSLEIPQASSVAVIGPNGSGKSTLLHAIAGVIEATSGSVDTHGAQAALVLQSTEVDPSVPITVGDAVAMARYPRLGLLRRFGPRDRQAVRSAIERLDLTDLAHRQIHHLSGGQRQRAFVAQALAQEAPIILLDEPLTGLDVRSRAVISDVLEAEQRAGCTTVTSTHDFGDAARCDLVLLLATRFVAFGPPEQVFTEDHLRAAFGGRFVRAGDTLVVDDPHHHH